MNKIPYLYDKAWLEHEIYYKEFNGYKFVEDISIENENVFFPLQIFKQAKNTNTVTFENFEMPYFFNRMDLESNSLKKMLKKTNALALDKLKYSGIQRCTMHQFPYYTYNRPFPFFYQFGHKTIFRGRSVIDTSKSLKEIWSNIRSRYRSNIKNDIDAKYYFGCLPQFVLNKIKLRHLQLAGRVTKPDICWNILKKFVDQKKALVVEYEGNYVYFLVSKYYSYYGISISERNTQNITHNLMWAAIKYLKEIGCEFIDLGIYYTTQVEFKISESEINDFDKIKNISHFKNGFANNTIMDFYSIVDLQKR